MYLDPTRYPDPLLLERCSHQDVTHPALLPHFWRGTLVSLAARYSLEYRASLLRHCTFCRRF